ncbi:MAG: hypothetical protein LBS96_02845 [Oscillospiraceae bacterium]|jgi:hypothetical protein|nr:hypothetical protein [Oscillospiraceae bacterium]
MKDGFRRHMARGAAIVLPLIILGGAAACGKDVGGVLFDDPLSGEHLLATDAHKNTVTNAEGMIIELQTEAYGRVVTQTDGSDVTLLMEYPCFVHEKKWGKTVLEVADFTVKLPKGWVVSRDTKRIVLLPDTDGAATTSMSYASSKESYDELKKQLQARESAWKDMMSASNTNSTVRSFTKEFFGKEAFFLEYDIPGGDESQAMIQVNGIVQPGDFCAEVNYQVTAQEYEDGKTFYSLVGLIEAK